MRKTIGTRKTVGPRRQAQHQDRCHNKADRTLGGAKRSGEWQPEKKLFDKSRSEARLASAASLKEPSKLRQSAVMAETMPVISQSQVAKPGNWRKTEQCDAAVLLATAKRTKRNRVSKCRKQHVATTRLAVGRGRSRPVTAVRTVNSAVLADGVLAQEGITSSAAIVQPEWKVRARQHCQDRAQIYQQRQADRNGACGSDLAATRCDALICDDPVLAQMFGMPVPGGVSRPLLLPAPVATFEVALSPDTGRQVFMSVMEQKLQGHDTNMVATACLQDSVAAVIALPDCREPWVVSRQDDASPLLSGLPALAQQDLWGAIGAWMQSAKLLLLRLVVKKRRKVQLARPSAKLHSKLRGGLDSAGSTPR